MKVWSRASLTTRIVVALVAGATLGVGLNLAGASESGVINTYVTDGLLRVIGTMFISALKLLVVPLVFVSLVSGVMSLKDIRALGRIGAKTLGFYLVTTAFAISLALLLAHMTQPGTGVGEVASTTFTPKPPPSLSQVVIDLVPSNPVAAMAQGNMLQIIVFALIFGLSIALVGERARRFVDLIFELNEIIMKMVGIVMVIAPYGVFCLITQTFANQGIGVILPLAGYFFTVLGALIAHLLVVYSGLLAILGRLNPVMFLRKMRAATTFAFSTASSSATIPVTLDAVENRLGAKNSIASFTVPLGATINMDGTAVMQGVATVFIANAYGIALPPSAYLTVVLTATLASIGTAGVPGVGLVMLTLVLNQVGLPVEGIALIIGVDRLLDMVRTAVNINGDAAVTCIVAKSEGQFDETVYQDPSAGTVQPVKLTVPAPDTETP